MSKSLSIFVYLKRQKKDVQGKIPLYARVTECEEEFVDLILNLLYLLKVNNYHIYEVKNMNFK